LTLETAIAASMMVPVQDTSAATRMTRVAMSMLALEHASASPTTGNVTGVAGTLHILDLSGITADRNFVLPDSVAVGTRIGVSVSVAAPTSTAYELNIVTAATGSLINGVNRGDGTFWSQLFIANEYVEFLCVKNGGAGDTDWIVTIDGRIPCCALMRLNADEGSKAAATFNKVGLDVADKNIGGIASTSAERVNIRRAGNYAVDIVGSVDLGTDGTMIGTVYVNGSEVQRPSRATTHATTGAAPGGGAVLLADLAAGAYVELYVWHDAGTHTHQGGVTPESNRMVVTEQLTR